MNNALLSQLLDPIPGDDICGTDMSFSPAFDEIIEARRQDDASLAQGEWETELKTAQWPRVKALTEDILRRQSKDIQVAAWYAEAMTRLQGFQGLTLGLQVMDGLVNDFWEFCYPSYDPDDIEERAGKIEWLNNQLHQAIRDIPLTDRAFGAYSLLKWEESRTVDNLGLKDPVAKEKAIAEGKLSGEVFDKAVQASGRNYYEKCHSQVKAAVHAFATLEKRVDERFGRDAPSLKDARQALQACDELVGKIFTRLGGHTQASKPAAALDSLEHGTSPANFVAPANPQAVGQIVRRSEAIQALRDVAQYFRQNEPHSPVALLAERAANWAEMPLDQWLASVIKDPSTLGQLRELLDIAEPHQ